MLKESTEYVHIPITGPDAATLTVGAIQVQFTTTKTIGTTWLSIDAYSATDGVAKVLVGPASANVLPVGTYYVAVKVSDNPEVPVLWAEGRLKVV